MTTVFYQSHAQAANISRELAANGTETLDLSHVRWGRLDYLNATEVMTRWLIFKSANSTSSVLVAVERELTSTLPSSP